MGPAKDPDAGPAEQPDASHAAVDAARAEASRLRARLSAAGAHLDALLPREEGAAPRGGVARFDDDDTVTSELRALLRPAAARVSRLLGLAGSVADGSLTDESAARAARLVADEQPHRRPR